MTSFKIPTRAQIDTVVQRLRSPEHAAYFFSRLQNPNWITPLKNSGLFKNPPPVIPIDGGNIQYPNWPASKYLAKMAEKAPDEVASIFSEIKTDNMSVIDDMLDAALTMPASASKILVTSICNAAISGTLGLHFHEASNLCVQLAEGGQPDAAMELAGALFKPTFKKGRKSFDWRNQFWYKEGFRQVTPLLARHKPFDFLPMLCDWLKASIEAEKRVKPDTGFDHSYTWRPAIEEHEQNLDYDFAGVMVGFVRGAFEEAIRSKSLTLDESLQIINAYTYLVFKRIQLHLIGEFADLNPDLARQKILDRGLFDNNNFRHEYAMLVGRRWDLLNPDQQNQWFGWIDTGLDMSNYDKSFRKRNGRDPTNQDRQTRINYWKFEKLHWVRKHLEGARKSFYEQMLHEYGEPDLADLNFRIGVPREFNDSPIKLEELQNMTFEQAVEQVSTWQPETPRFMGPNIESLASTFSNYVATNPEAFSAEARILIGRPAIYINHFISQMDNAVKNDRRIDLTAVLELCQWVIAQPVEERTTPEQQDEMLVDKDWQWTRDTISRFIENICKAKHDDAPVYPPNKFRKILWQLINSLCHDSSKSSIVCDISKDDPRIHDYVNLGMNSPRGRAIEVALEYARWVANHIKTIEGEKEIVPDGFNAMPEVRQMLEEQIAPANRSVVVMSIIGIRIGLIYWIDKNWLKQNTENIFSLKGIGQKPPVLEDWAAWNSFLAWSPSHIEFYSLLKSQFAYAVEQAAKVDLTEDSREQPMCCLGEHLMRLYGRGQLQMDDDDGLLKRFLTTANPTIRRHAISFVGQSLEEKNLPKEVIERFMVLWQFYWESTGKKDATNSPDAGLFGMWFANGQFPHDWALNYLKEFVDILPTPEPDYSIYKKLAEIAHIDILKSVQILDRMVRGDREGWRIRGSCDSAQTILRQAINTTGEARDIAVSLIDHLGRRGYTDFGKLLSES